MVNLSSDVAAALEEQYGEDVVNEYEELMPREAMEQQQDAYSRVETLAGEMHPDHLAEAYEEQGLADAVTEAGQMAEDWKEAALQYLIGQAMQDEMEDTELG